MRILRNLFLCGIVLALGFSALYAEVEKGGYFTKVNIWY